MAEAKKQNIFQKIQNVRVELQGMDLKKSGLNTFSKFAYFELRDFLPQANTLMQKYNLFAYDEIDTVTATITVVDCDDLDTIPFSITMPSTVVELKGATAIQSLGSVQTYMRRYLYVSLLSIVESDTLDGTLGKDTDKPKSTPKSKAPVDPNDSLVKMKALCMKLKDDGKQPQVMTIVESIAKVKNPNAVKDHDIAAKIIVELEKI